MGLDNPRDVTPARIRHFAERAGLHLTEWQAYFLVALLNREEATRILFTSPQMGGARAFLSLNPFLEAELIV